MLRTENTPCPLAFPSGGKETSFLSSYLHAQMTKYGTKVFLYQTWSLFIATLLVYFRYGI